MVRRGTCNERANLGSVRRGDQRSEGCFVTLVRETREWIERGAVVACAAVVVAFVSACSGVSPSERTPRSSARPKATAPDRVTAQPTMSARTSASAAPLPRAEVVQGRTMLGLPVATNLPTSIERLPTERAVLVVSHAADERESFVRWIDEAGHVGPIVRILDEYVVTAFAREDKKRELVTSDGERLCIARFAPEATAPEACACEAIDAKAVAVVNRKLAVISLEEHKTTADKPTAKAPAKATKLAPRRTSEPKKPAVKPQSKKKPTPQKKKKSQTKKKNTAKKITAESKVKIVRRDVEVLARWATSDGFGEAKKTGLKFVPPLDGMTIVDAKATAGGVLLAWFEKAKPSASAPKVGAKGALGWAAIFSGIVGEDGAFDEKSKKLVVEGALDWGFLRGFSGPRFVDMMSGPALLTQKASRGGACEVTKMNEAVPVALPQSTCAIDPGALPNVDTKAFDTILQAEPRRRPGQPKYDAELVAWAGERAYFVTNDGRKLHSAKRDGGVREEPAPFVARRARMTKAALRPDGSGVAMVDGQTYRVNAAGELRVDEEPGKTQGATSSAGVDGPWNVSSAVRPGYRVIERQDGGAIVVGVAPSNDENIVALQMGTNGSSGAVVTTSLHVVSGEFEIRTSALPGGGGWISDRDRRRVIWVDDDGREKAAAEWPEGQANAVCRDGVPGKRFVPSVVPGEFVDVPALAAPGICVVGEPAWAADGSLRWFGTYADGLDVLPEVRILRDIGKIFAAPTKFVERASTKSKAPCPPDMVLVNGKLCVDRFEATIVDVEGGRALSPDFPVTPNLFEIALGDWATGRSRVGSVFARAMPLPLLPEWQRGKKLDVVATARPRKRPNGYLTGLIAESACTAAGKRLCTLDEFVLACRGEDDLQFPYGDTYVDGACNVNRDVHPAAMLHDNASMGHLDPRLNRVPVGGSTLLRETGATPMCRSRWGNDAIYDMVGNLDEWVDEEGGAFAGGFYARSTRAGCDAVITAHPKTYLDYSTGVRCCKNADK